MRLQAGAEGGRMHQVIDAQPGFENGSEGVEHDEVVAMGLTTNEPRSQIHF